MSDSTTLRDYTPRAYQSLEFESKFIHLDGVDDWIFSFHRALHRGTAVQLFRAAMSLMGLVSRVPSVRRYVTV